MGLGKDFWGLSTVAQVLSATIEQMESSKIKMLSTVKEEIPSQVEGK